MSTDNAPRVNPGLLSVDQLKDDVARGAIDTVLVVFPDLAGSW